MNTSGCNWAILGSAYHTADLRSCAFMIRPMVYLRRNNWLVRCVSHNCFLNTTYSEINSSWNSFWCRKSMYDICTTCICVQAWCKLSVQEWQHPCYHLKDSPQQSIKTPRLKEADIMPVKVVSLKPISDCKLTLLDQNDSVDAHVAYKALLGQLLATEANCATFCMSRGSDEFSFMGCSLHVLWDQRAWSSVFSVLLTDINWYLNAFEMSLVRMTSTLVGCLLGYKSSPLQLLQLYIFNPFLPFCWCHSHLFKLILHSWRQGCLDRLFFLWHNILCLTHHTYFHI